VPGPKLPANQIQQQDGGHAAQKRQRSHRHDRRAEPFHIGFFIEGEAAVDDLYRRLREDGYDLADPHRNHAYGFYVQAPGGFTVEVGAWQSSASNRPEETRWLR
jgi:hypothetical protein